MNPMTTKDKVTELRLASLERDVRAMKEKLSRLDYVAEATGLHVHAENFMDPIDDLFDDLFRRVWELETKRRRPG
ncbi:MAG: hypothetical protein K1X57_19040 [Gemmataceae bacterium]|nr:hypothetical protein [Gemmataceae bacterium]